MVYKCMIIVILSFLLMSGCTTSSPYEDLPHHGQQAIRYVELEGVPFYVDARQTSMAGQWFMKDSLLYFVDSYMVGLKVFDQYGKFLSEEIRQGRGPDEMVAPAWVSAIDEVTGQLVMQDNNAALLKYDGEYHQTFNTLSAWFLCVDTSFLESSWRDLYNHPDPEVVQMYEYNFPVRRMRVWDDTLYMPVISDHVAYNAYDVRSNAKQFWKNAHTFLFFDIADMKHSCRLFGNYPPIYQRQNIPAFAFYDFVVTSDRLYVSFAADSLIYVYDRQGDLLYSLGFGQEEIKGAYPATYSFEEHERVHTMQKEEYGYYDRLYANGGRLFRTCKTDAGKWYLQVYEREDLVGNVPLQKPLEIFGCYEGWYYAFQGTDFAHERFEMLKFRL